MDAYAETQEQRVYRQWLNRIPDDPSGLLRRKFEIQSQQQLQQQETKEW
ncbi:MAG: hypothetical protein Q9M28_07445 [Mariprofundaceae bacterium]|nr:hypothetical protein [Mariprofundaceae bacterium]